MPEIPAQTAEERPEPEEGKTYTITEVEQLSTAVQSYNGIRVTMTDAENNTVSTMLWIRPVVGTRSKLGSFISVLGNNTDNWIGKKIQIVSWRQRAREIKLVEP